MMQPNRLMCSTLRLAARHRPLPSDLHLWRKDTATMPVSMSCRLMALVPSSMSRQMSTSQPHFNPKLPYDNIHKNSEDENSDSYGSSQHHNIRLSKRMSELGICSRREAAAILKEASECRDESSLKHLKEVIYLRGKPVMGGAAVKIPPNETFIEIRAGNDPPKENEESTEYVPYCDRTWDEIKGDTIVLNKPIGYVSGQEEHQHVPAVRLLSRKNMHLDDFYFSDKEHADFKKGDALHFDRWKFDGFDKMANSVPKKIRETFSDDKLNEKSRSTAETLTGYAPAGRLDIDSTGVILFTRAGIMARRLIEPQSNIRKEYIVKVEPAVQPTARELDMGLTRLPTPTRDLSILLRKRNKLWGEVKQLKPLIEAEWIDDVDVTGQQANRGNMNDNLQQQSRTMRLVLVEGKKRQIRRMCREILGWHVVELTRISVGPVHIDSLPKGKWRPLTQTEVKAIFEEQEEPKTWAKPVALSASEKIAKLIEENPELPHEKEVMKAVLAVLRNRKHHSSGDSVSSPIIRKKVVQYLDDFDPKTSSRLNKKWKQYFELVITNNRKK